MKVSHAMIANGDAGHLARHLEVFARFCDAICVCVGDDPQTHEVCRAAGVNIIRQPEEARREGYNARGAIFRGEGAARQAAWDAATATGADLILLADADEFPTPDVVAWLASDPDPTVDVWYADWVNLWGSERKAIGGSKSPWSFQRRDSNKKALAVRVRPGVVYRYSATQKQHVRMEPNPLCPWCACVDERHRLLTSPKVIHHKWVDVDRWDTDPLKRTDYYADVLKDAELVDVPAEWLWQ